MAVEPAPLAEDDFRHRPRWLLAVRGRRSARATRRRRDRPGAEHRGEPCPLRRAGRRPRTVARRPRLARPAHRGTVTYVHDDAGFKEWEHDHGRAVAFLIEELF